jgi:hypothetical protein
MEYFSNILKMNTLSVNFLNKTTESRQTTETISNIESPQIKVITYNVLEQSLAVLLNGRSFGSSSFNEPINSTITFTKNNEPKKIKLSDIIGQTYEVYRTPPDSLSRAERKAITKIFFEGSYKDLYIYFNDETIKKYIIKQTQTISNNELLSEEENYYNRCNYLLTFNDIIDNIQSNTNLDYIYKNEIVNITFTLNDIESFNIIIELLKISNAELNLEKRLSKVFTSLIESIDRNTIIALQENSEEMFTEFTYNNKTQTLLNHLNEIGNYCCIIGADSLETDVKYKDLYNYGGAAIFIPTDYFDNILLEKKNYIILYKNVADEYLPSPEVLDEKNIIIVKPTLELYDYMKTIMGVERNSFLTETQRHTKGRTTICLKGLRLGVQELIISGHFESDSNEVKGTRYIKQLTFLRIHNEIEQFKLLYPGGQVILLGDFNSNPREICKTLPNNFIRKENGTYEYTLAEITLISQPIFTHDVKFKISKDERYKYTTRDISDGGKKTIDWIGTTYNIIPIDTELTEYPVEETGTDHKMVQCYITKLPITEDDEFYELV